MKVIEHSSSQLVILSGEFGHLLGKPSIMDSGHNLFRMALIWIVITGVNIFIIQNFILTGILMMSSIPLLISSLAVIDMRISGEGRPETYKFDKISNLFSWSKPAFFPWNSPQTISFLLNEIVELESVIKKEDDPPPLYWYSLELKMKDKTITLYPGHNEKEMNEMGGLIRTFLGL